MTKKKLLILGWDAAEWNVIDQLLAEGKLPALKRVIEAGVSGKIATMDPPISPMLWTSIATGVPPEIHGILGFAEPDPEGKGLRPLYSTSRKVKAFWNMLNQSGLKCNVISWWPSHPAEPINGVMISNFFQMVTSKDPLNWPMPDGTIHPKTLQNALKNIRVHPEEITYAHVLPFIPKLFSINGEKDQMVGVIRKEVAHATTVQSALTWALEHTEWDVTAVYFDMIDHLSHLGMKFRPPKRNAVPEDKFDLYNGIVDAAYRFQDMMLERVLDLIDEDTAIMMLSDHGFESGAMRPTYLPSEPAGPTHEHSPFGIFCFAGPGIRKNEKIYGTSLLDITPTVLAYFNLPIGKNMQGKALVHAFETPPELSFVDSWEELNHGDSGQHPSDHRIDPWSAKEALDQLIELGYIDRPAEDNEKAVKDSRAEISFYLARCHLHSKNPHLAAPLLDQLVIDYPEIFRYRSLYAQCLLNLKEYQKCRIQIDSLMQMDGPAKSFAHFLSGNLWFAQFKGKKAIKSFNEALNLAPNSNKILLQLANVYLSMSRFEESISYFKQVLNTDPRNVNALYGIGIAYLKSSNYDDSIDSLLQCIEFLNFFPQAHYQLGEALRLSGEFEHAQNAYRYAISQAPGMIKARERLKMLYAGPLADQQKLNELEAELVKLRKGEITVISGLPCSGAKELSEFLTTNGISVELNKYDELLTEESGNRNPLKSEDLKALSGKIVFLPPSLLLQIPVDWKVNVILTERNWPDMLKAQLELAGKESRLNMKVFPTRLDELNKQQIHLINDWMLTRPGIDFMRIEYDSIISEPDEAKESVQSFLFHNN